MNPHSPSRNLLHLLGTVALTLLSAHAQLRWDANGTNSGQTNGGGAWLANNLWWNGTANQSWTPGSHAIFGGASTNGGAVTLANPTAVGSLTFNTFTGTYTLGTAGQTITVHGDITMNPTAGAVSLTVSPIALGASQTWTNHSAQSLTARSGVNNAGHTLTIDGAGQTFFDSTANIITGSGGLTKNGTGRLTLGSGGTIPAHNYSGTTTLNGGVTMVANNNIGTGNLILNGGVYESYWNTHFIRALGSGNGAVQIPGGESGFSMNGANTLNVVFGNNANNEVAWGSALFDPSVFVLQAASAQAGSIMNFQNKLDLQGAPRTIRSNATAPAVTATLSGVIRNSSATASGLIKTGPGHIVLSAANTYNGGTTIHEGTLRFASLSAMPASGAVSVNSGGTIGITMGAAGQWTTASSGHGTLGGLLSGSGGQSGSTVSFSGNVGLFLETTGTLAYDPSIADVGDRLSLVKTGAGTLTLSGNNTYTGKTSLFGGTLVINSLRNVGEGPSSLGQPADAIQGAIAIGSNTTAGTLRYTGAGDTSNRVIELAGRTGGVTLEANGTGALVLTSDLVPTFPTTANNQANKTLTLSGTNTGPNALSGLIPNTTLGTATSTLALTKSGTGRWVLAHASNTYTGVTHVSAGVLEVSKLANGGTASSIGASSGSEANLLLSDGATLRYTGEGDLTDRRFRINGSANGHGATIDSSGSGALNFTLSDSPAYGTANQTRTLTLRGTNTGENIFAANIENNGSGAVSLIKEDTGSWTLTGNNLHSGTTTVNQGTLVVNGSLEASNVIVNGGILAGTATIAGTVTVQPGGTLFPGHPFGTMHTGNVNLAGVFAVELADRGADTEPVLEVEGLLNLSGSTLHLDITATSIQPFYLIATYGSLAGTFSTINGLPPGWSVNYQYGDNNTIAIVPPAPVSVPGPPTALLASQGISADGSTSLIQLDWNTSSGAWTYAIKRSLVSGGPYTTIATTAQRNYQDLSVQPGQTYHYIVVAENPLGFSADSAEAFATAVAPPPPAQPDGLTVSTDNGIIRLNWNATAAASGYIVKRSATAGGPYTAVATVATPGYLETTGVVGTVYHYVIVALNSGGEGPESSAVSALFTGDPILTAVDQLKGHITGLTPLTSEQLAQASLTLKAQTPRFGESASTITAVFDLVTTFDTVKGPLFVSHVTGGLTRSAETNDLNWTIYRTMQGIMDRVYTPQNLANHEALLGGFRFGSHTHFPGPCAPPAASVTHVVPINASFPRTFGRDTLQWTLPARKPTGTYLAPGTVATITVPSALVNAGYQLRVGAHSWDLSNRPIIHRLDRATLRFPITSLTIKVTSPYGGGIYLEVPIGASAGIVSVSITGAVRSPYFSAKSFHQTTPAEWEIERNHPAPWADFQSEKFMSQVPRKWISNMTGTQATQLMVDWDKAMDAINSLMGFPLARGKETMYAQVDLIMRSSVHAPGYPAVNVTGNPNSEVSPVGYSGNYLVRGPGASPTAANIEFHEQGHAYLFPKFGGESESNVNLLQPALLHRKFGYSLDVAHAGSLGYSSGVTHSLDNTAVAWMCCFSFSPHKTPMQPLEKQYQLKGHAKFMDIARLFGWEGMDAYWRSFMQDDAAGISYANTDDEKLLRLSRHVGKDLRPLFHFWGVHPQNPSALAASFAAENIPASVEIRNLLLHYKTLVPANNAAYRTFMLNWWGKKPSVAGYWEETDHAMQWDETLDADGSNNPNVRPNGSIYVEDSANDIRNRVDELVALYFPPEISPNPMGFVNAPAAVAADTISMTASTATTVVGPVEYLFENTTNGHSSGWISSPSWSNTGLASGTTHHYRVKARGAINNETDWSATASATTPQADPYAAWSGGAAFGSDANGDGVTNGIAWVLGTTDVHMPARQLLPVIDHTTEPDYLIFTYRRKADAHSDANTTIKVEYGSDLVGWTEAAAGEHVIITTTADVAPGIDSVKVKIHRSLATGEKLFARLHARKSP